MHYCRCVGRDVGNIDATPCTLALAAGEMSEAAYADWLKANSRRV